MQSIATGEVQLARGNRSGRSSPRARRTIEQEQVYSIEEENQLVQGNRFEISSSTIEPDQEEDPSDRDKENRRSNEQHPRPLNKKVSDTSKCDSPEAKSIAVQRMTPV